MPQFEHSSVNHILNFIDPNYSYSKYERLWSRSKYYLRKKRGILFENILFNIVFPQYTQKKKDE
jgi:hypothetical protein